MRNAQESFTRLLTSILQELNGEGLVLFLDDALVYSAKMEEHYQHLRSLFVILRKERLYSKRYKRELGITEVEFLGHVVYQEGVNMQNDLKSAKLDWPTPT